MSSEEVEAALLEVGASSITFLDRGDEPVLEPKPGEIRLWSDTLVRALFDESARRARRESRSPRATAWDRTSRRAARVRAVESQDWERVGSRTGSRCASGDACGFARRTAPPPEDPDAVVVRLDPGLAFGTGTHPTTALCLQILDALPLAGRSVIDYGCGSGILGIAALKLGAAHVVAVDLDPQALLATRENAVRNGVSLAARDRRAFRPRLAAGELRGREHSRGTADRIGADPDGGVLSRRRSVPVRSLEDAGLCGQGRIRLGF